MILFVSFIIDQIKFARYVRQESTYVKSINISRQTDPSDTNRNLRCSFVAQLAFLAL